AAARAGRRRHDRGSLVCVPSAPRAGRWAPACVCPGVRPFMPRMVIAIAEQERFELLDQGRPACRWKRADDADVLKMPVVVEAEQHGTEQWLLRRGCLVPAEACKYAVGGALVLDLEHHTLGWMIHEIQRLGDHAVPARALEFGEPALGQLMIRRRRREMHRAARAVEGLDQRSTALGERPLRVVVIA